MRRLLVKLQPLEPYFFGDENTIRFDGSHHYYVSSVNTPSAMTIMGTLRYTLLEQAGYIRTDGKYTPGEQAHNDALVGSHSFVPGEEDSYGVIQGVSPLFLTDEAGGVYVPLPKNHSTAAEHTHYIPIKLGDKVTTSFGDIALPLPGELSAKNLVDDSQYVRVTDGYIARGVFSDFVKVTNKKDKERGSYLKKKMKLLSPGYAFGVMVDLADGATLNNSVCYMGREKSAFSLRTEEGFDAEALICQGALAGSNCHYAWGDLILKQPPAYTAYAITATRQLRYLSSTMDEDGRLKIRRGEVLHNVIGAGSVLYAGEDVTLLGNDRFGVNKLITLGGAVE